MLERGVFLIPIPPLSKFLRPATGNGGGIAGACCSTMPGREEDPAVRMQAGLPVLSFPGKPGICNCGRRPLAHKQYTGAEVSPQKAG